MSKQGTCPLSGASGTWQVCVEENCAWWIPKGRGKRGVIQDGVFKGATVYEHEGCCAVVAIAIRIWR